MNPWDRHISIRSRLSLMPVVLPMSSIALDISILCLI